MLEKIPPEDLIIEETEQKQPWDKGPIKIILALFLILLIILWIFPHYGLKQNPEPTYTPTLQELNIPKLQIPNLQSTNIQDYLQVTPEIKQIADKIITLSCPQTHPVCNAKALFYFVQKNFNYLSDPLAFEYYKTPQESFLTLSGDCDDASLNLGSLLQAVGFQTRFVKVPHHLYLQVKIPEAVSSYKTEQDWINLDPTCKDCPFGEIHYSYADSHKQYLG